MVFKEAQAFPVRHNEYRHAILKEWAALGMRQLDGQWQPAPATRLWLLFERPVCCVEIRTRSQQITARFVVEVAEGTGCHQTSRRHGFRGEGTLRPVKTDPHVEI